MRSIFFVIAMSMATACATTGANRPVNVAAVRTEINETIASQNGGRSIHSMGKTSAERAVVYTTAKDGTKQEESWVKDGAGWKLENATALSGTPQSNAN